MTFSKEINYMVTYNVSLENKVVLVTGAAGFIGANLVKRLLNESDRGIIYLMGRTVRLHDAHHLFMVQLVRDAATVEGRFIL